MTIKREKYPWWLSKKLKRELNLEDMAERKWAAEETYKFWTKTWPNQQLAIFNKRPMWREFIKPKETDA